MKQFCIVLFFLFTGQAFAQEASTPLVSLEAFQERLKEASGKIQSIEADFRQDKYLDVFAETIVSKGSFAYRKEEKIRLEYTDPLAYLMVINGNQLKILSDGKTNIVSLGTNPMMQEMKTLIAASMIGDLGSLSAGYMTHFLENASSYIARIEPKSAAARQYIREITITFSKTDMSVTTLRLAEAGEDYTEYHFTNRRYNTINSDELFAIP